MTVLAVAITTKGGKPLLSRQFRDITKDRVKELLSNFQNLVANSSRQHTFVEEEHVRYVYKPFDDYYIILVTNRQSNIIQDVDTLNLFSQTVNSNLKGFREDEIMDSAFDILGSFDEIICLGYKENLSLSQINTFLAMESPEEKIQEMIDRSKESEAAEIRKRRANEIHRKELERKMGMLPTGDDAATKFQGTNDQNMSNAYNSYYSHASPAAQQTYKHLQQQSQTDGSLNDNLYSVAAASKTSRGSSMKLGGGRKNIAGTEGVPAGGSTLSSRGASKPAPSSLQPEEERPVNNGILVSIKETVNAEITRDGSITTSELKGVLELRVNDPDLAHAKIKLDNKVAVSDRSFQFKTHPNVDKNLFLSSKVIGLRDPKKAFPSNDQTLGVLRWRKVGSADDNSLIPLQVSTWVSPSGDSIFDVTIEYEINEDYKQSLESITFVIPLYTTNATIKDENDVNATIESIEEHGLIIKVNPLEAGQSGVFSISIEAPQEDSLFPINVLFTNPNVSSAFSHILVDQILSAEDEDNQLPFDVVSVLRTDEYVVV